MIQSATSPSTWRVALNGAVMGLDAAQMGEHLTVTGEQDQDVVNRLTRAAERGVIAGHLERRSREAAGNTGKVN